MTNGRYEIGRLSSAVFFSVFFLLFIQSGAVFAFNEAPSLAESVKKGLLPPVEKRLPESPAVVTPFDRPGQYGGLWRRGYTGLPDLVGARRILYDPLVRWSPDYKIIPNLARKWEILENGRVFVFHLVKGVKWSDGQPFTADDIAFFFEDIIGDKELTRSIPKWLSPGGEMPKFKKIDDYSFSIEFDKPYGLFLEELATPKGMAVVTRPKHYLKKFHKKYLKPEELEALLAQKKAHNWVKVFDEAADLQHGLFVNKELPSICAWITTVPAPAKRFTMVRNPYYWKVDTAGNQLPYIDSIMHELTSDSETLFLKAVAGEIDMQGRGLGGRQKALLLEKFEDTGKYRLVPKSSTASVGLLLAPNLNHKDPVMKQIMSDRRFRIALSHAVSRYEINKIYGDKGIPRQAAPLSFSEYYSPSYEKAYLEYDPAKAAALLDEMGLKKGPDGKRLRPDGKPLQLTIDISGKIPINVDIAEITASNIKALGIPTELKSEAPELFRLRTQGGSHDMAMWSGDGGLECLLEPRWFFPYSTESLNAPLYGQWFQSDGKAGEEPPAEIKELMDIYKKILTSASSDERKELFKKIIEANEKNLWVIGLVYDPDDYYVVAKNMFNLPKKDFQSWIYPNPGPINPEQFSFAVK